MTSYFNWYKELPDNILLFKHTFFDVAHYSKEEGFVISKPNGQEITYDIVINIFWKIWDEITLEKDLYLSMEYLESKDIRKYYQHYLY